MKENSPLSSAREQHEQQFRGDKRFGIADNRYVGLEVRDIGKAHHHHRRFQRGRTRTTALRALSAAKAEALTRSPRALEDGQVG